MAFFLSNIHVVLLCQLVVYLFGTDRVKNKKENIAVCCIRQTVFIYFFFF